MQVNAWLSPLLPWLPRSRLRLRLARAAAGRGDPRALKAEPRDPLVLGRLGLFEAALAIPAKNGRGRAGHALALAGLGRTSELLALLTRTELSRSERHDLARRLAFHDPASADALAADAEPRLRGALALVTGRPAPAELGKLHDREALAVRAALAGRERAWREARRLLNGVFAVDELATPLDPDLDGPLALGELTATPDASFGGETVSAIVPVREPGPFFRASIRSLLRQTWRDLEIVIVNDGACDLAGLVAPLLAEQPRIRIVRNDRAPGAYGARNCGIAQSRGALILLHDADDWAHPERVARQAVALRNRVAVVSDHVRLAPDGTVMTPRVAPLLRINPACLLVRRAALDRIGPFEEVRTGADSEFLARLDLRFGRRRVQRDHSLLTIASWTPASLSGDPHRGVRSGAGRDERLRYRHDWMARHAGFRHGLA